jgi:hypothetical protein
LSRLSAVVLKVAATMTLHRRRLKRLGASPVRGCIGLQGMPIVQETHICVLEAPNTNCSWWERCFRGVDVANLGKFKIGTGSETHASRESLSACEIGIRATRSAPRGLCHHGRMWLNEVLIESTRRAMKSSLLVGLLLGRRGRGCRRLITCQS